MKGRGERRRRKSAERLAWEDGRAKAFEHAAVLADSWANQATGSSAEVLRSLASVLRALKEAENESESAVGRY